MDYAYMLGGGAPLVMKIASGDTHANAGVVTTAAGAEQAAIQAIEDPLLTGGPSLTRRSKGASESSGSVRVAA